jgi:hypothetical protein
MSIQIVKPKITNIKNTAWTSFLSQMKKKDIRKRFLILSAIFTIPGWIFILFGNIGEGIFAIFISPLFIIFILYIGNLDKTTDSFWQQLATANYWKYTGDKDCSHEMGIMFRQGDKNMENKGVSITNCIEGNAGDHRFRIFNFHLVTGGSGKNKSSFGYTVFSFKFEGNFPHIYLNNKHNSMGIKINNYIPIPGEFEKQFLLSAPKEYEVEALQIFTPDVLAYFLDNGLYYDIEFVDQEMLVFTDKQINNIDDFEKKFNHIIGLKELFEKKLDTLKFEKIGDKPFNL